MKQPHQGLRSMTPQLPCLTNPTSAHNHSMLNLIPHTNTITTSTKTKIHPQPLPTSSMTLMTTLTNIICFGAFF
jgi:hypothetical protein